MNSTQEDLELEQAKRVYRNKTKAAWRAEAEERRLLREKLEASYACQSWGKVTLDRLWNMAWDRGHSGGYQEVEAEYCGLSNLIREFAADNNSSQ
jgi:hypothetical protein